MKKLIILLTIAPMILFAQQPCSKITAGEILEVNRSILSNLSGFQFKDSVKESSKITYVFNNKGNDELQVIYNINGGAAQLSYVVAPEAMIEKILTSYYLVKLDKQIKQLNRHSWSINCNGSSYKLYLSDFEEEPGYWQLVAR